jgi:hypothetical protein
MFSKAQEANDAAPFDFSSHDQTASAGGESGRLSEAQLGLDRYLRWAVFKRHWGLPAMETHNDLPLWRAGRR